jgi:hypothetical protein
LCRDSGDPGLSNRVGLIKRARDLCETLNDVRVSGHAVS